MLSCLEAFTATNCKNAAIKFAMSSMCLPVTTHEPLNRLPQNLILWNLYWNLIVQSAFGENFKYKWTLCKPTCIKWNLPPVTIHKDWIDFLKIWYFGICTETCQHSLLLMKISIISGQCVDTHALNEIY